MTPLAASDLVKFGITQLVIQLASWSFLPPTIPLVAMVSVTGALLDPPLVLAWLLGAELAELAGVSAPDWLDAGAELAGAELAGAELAGAADDAGGALEGPGVLDVPGAEELPQADNTMVAAAAAATSTTIRRRLFMRGPFQCAAE